MAHPYIPFRTTVVAKTQLTPGFIRVTLQAAALQHYAKHGLDQRIKIVLQLPGGGYGEFGILDEVAPAMTEWYATWRELPDEQRNTIRTFTASGIRPEQGEIDIDFVIHHPAGPASAWAIQADLGDELVVIGPNAQSPESTGGLDYQPGSADTIVLTADETAIPALRNILDAADPTQKIYAFVESAHRADFATLVARSANHHIASFVRGDTDNGAQTLAAVRAWTAQHHPAELNFYAWVAGESSVIKEVRRAFVRDSGVAPSAVTFSGYWKRGQSEN